MKTKRNLQDAISNAIQNNRENLKPIGTLLTDKDTATSHKASQEPVRPVSASVNGNVAKNSLKLSDSITGSIKDNLDKSDIPNILENNESEQIELLISKYLDESNTESTADMTEIELEQMEASEGKLYYTDDILNLLEELTNKYPNFRIEDIQNEEYKKVISIAKENYCDYILSDDIDVAGFSTYEDVVGYLHDCYNMFMEHLDRVLDYMFEIKDDIENSDGTNDVYFNIASEHIQLQDDYNHLKEKLKQYEELTEMQSKVLLRNLEDEEDQDDIDYQVFGGCDDTDEFYNDDWNEEEFIKIATDNIEQFITENKDMLYTVYGDYYTIQYDKHGTDTEIYADAYYLDYEDCKRGKEADVSIRFNCLEELYNYVKEEYNFIMELKSI